MLSASKIALSVLLFTAYFDSFRLAGVPVYDLAALVALLAVPITFPKSLRPAAFFFSYLLTCMLVCIYFAAFGELARYVMSAVFLYLGFEFGRFDHTNRVITKFLLLSLVMNLYIYYFQSIPDHPAAVGPLSTLGVFSRDRFSAAFNDPTKFAAFYYMPFVSGCFGNAVVTFSIAAIAKSRFAMLVVIMRKILGRRHYLFPVLIGVVSVLLIVVYFSQVNRELVAVSQDIRPDSTSSTSFDYVRTLSMRLLFEASMGTYAVPFVGPGHMHEFMSGIPPHNSILSTWMEMGPIGPAMLLFAIAGTFFCIDPKSRISFLLLAAVFINFDAESYRMLYFYIGLMIQRSGAIRLRKRSSKKFSPV